MEILNRYPYRAGIGLMVTSILILFWMIGALGIIADSGDRVDMLYLGVLGVGLAGTALARFRPGGMAKTLYAMAAAQVVVALIAIFGGLIPEYNSVFEILGLNAFFVAMFMGSGMLFRQAGHQRSAA